MGNRPLRVAVVGSINFDIVVKVPRLIREGESLPASGLKTFAGGKGANQAIATRRLGAETNLIGAVGGDAFGAFLRKELEKGGLDLRSVKTDPDRNTGCGFISLLPSGNNVIVVDGGANYGIRAADIEAARPVIEAADVLMTVLEIPLEVVEASLRIARQAGKFTVLDAGPARPCPVEILSLADIVSPNETELEKLSGEKVTDLDSAIAAARKLISEGVREMVLKLGSRGSMWVRAGEAKHFPPYKIEVLDTTAAGDAFTAALALELGAKKPVAEAVPYANLAGAWAATKLGAMPSMPTRDELRKFQTQVRVRTP